MCADDAYTYECADASADSESIALDAEFDVYHLFVDGADLTSGAYPLTVELDASTFRLDDAGVADHRFAMNADLRAVADRAAERALPPAARPASAVILLFPPM